jgi:cytoplasmic iron level regulating protein YaaA (DUF328/UPF0246 family)
MIAILSPAKKLNFKKETPQKSNTQIRFPNEAKELVQNLRHFAPKELMHLMTISSNLAELNAERLHKWHWPFVEKESRQAIYAFNGEAYNGLGAFSLSNNEIDIAQKQLRMLSGLYGILRPLDLILPYRLEMGTKLKNSKGKNLYEFWGDKITDSLNKDIKKGQHKALINLASQEYFKAINPGKIETKIITPVFKENKYGTYKVISVYAKKARGMMVRFIIQNKLTDPEELKAFETEGYYFNNEMSKSNEMVFTRH